MFLESSIDNIINAVISGNNISVEDGDFSDNSLVENDDKDNDKNDFKENNKNLSNKKDEQRKNEMLYSINKNIIKDNIKNEKEDDVHNKKINEGAAKEQKLSAMDIKKKYFDGNKFVNLEDKTEEEKRKIILAVVNCKRKYDNSIANILTNYSISNGIQEYVYNNNVKQKMDPIYTVIYANADFDDIKNRREGITEENIKFLQDQYKTDQFRLGDNFCFGKKEQVPIYVLVQENFTMYGIPIYNQFFTEEYINTLIFNHIVDSGRFINLVMKPYKVEIKYNLLAFPTYYAYLQGNAINLSIVKLAPFVDTLSRPHYIYVPQLKKIFLKYYLLKNIIIELQVSPSEFNLK
jgi:hypothetical protein